MTNHGAFDEAEAILVALRERRPACLLDLSWLEERRGDLARALAHVEAHLRLHPDDAAAARTAARLKAKLLDAAQVLDEVDSLVALGEPVGIGTLERFVGVAAARGEIDRVRAVLEPRLATLTASEAVTLGYAAYHAMAWDLAADLMILGVAARGDDPKFVSSLEKAAKNSGRVEEVCAAYDAAGSRYGWLYGRAKKLRRGSG